MNAKPILPVVIALSAIFLLAPANQINAREFTSSDGKKMEATIVAVRGENVVVKRGTKQFTLPIKRLSLEDQGFIAEWSRKKMENRLPKLKVEINSGKSERSDRQDNYDDRKGSFQISIKITNEELDYNLKDCKASLSVIGEDCETSKRYGIMQKSSFAVNARPGKTFAWKGGALHYKFDTNPPVVWGSRYYGYVIQIKNAQGKVVYKAAMPKRFADSVDKILSFGKEEAFDKTMESRGSIQIYQN